MQPDALQKQIEDVYDSVPFLGTILMITQEFTVIERIEAMMELIGKTDPQIEGIEYLGLIDLDEEKSILYEESKIVFLKGKALTIEVMIGDGDVIWSLHFVRRDNPAHLPNLIEQDILSLKTVLKNHPKLNPSIMVGITSQDFIKMAKHLQNAYQLPIYIEGEFNITDDAIIAFLDISRFFN